MQFLLTCLVLVGLVNSLYGKLFRFDYTYYERAEGYLKLHVMPANWHEARLRCHLEGSVVASPLTTELRSVMADIMTAKKGRLTYTGIFTGIHATFSKGDFHTIEGVPLSKIPQIWAENEPDNFNDQEQCIKMYPNGHLADYSCIGLLPYFCYKKGKNLVMNSCGTTDPDYALDFRTGSCYKFHNEPRTWSRPFMACTAEGGYLAIINSETESTVIKEIFAKHPENSIQGNFFKRIAFIGFHDWDEHGEFLTIQGETLKKAGFDKFDSGEPSNATNGEYCGAIYINGLFNDRWCEAKYTFICEKDPGSLLKDNDSTELKEQ